MAAQLRRRPDAGQEQERGGSDGARGHDHLAVGTQELRAPISHDLHADRATALDHDAIDHDVGADREIGSAQGRTEVARGGAAAPAMAGGGLV